ncbi:hypothetical protein WJX81_004716 [Elliptochloris bilobata]|uniref:BZIP domain-containing protein n=1 Tax=Elliptochloris bilobata TaxID=381761 RepID=A0AAW1RRE2_9CHLO
MSGSAGAPLEPGALVANGGLPRAAARGADLPERGRGEVVAPLGPGPLMPDGWGAVCGGASFMDVCDEEGLVGFQGGFQSNHGGAYPDLPGIADESELAAVLGLLPPAAAQHAARLSAAGPRLNSEPASKPNGGPHERQASAAAGGSSEARQSRNSETSSSGADEEAVLVPGLRSGSANGSVSGARATRVRIKEEAADEKDELLTGLSKQELKRAQNRRIQHRFREKERARKKELETKAAMWDDRGSKLQRELATLRQENMRLTHSMQVREMRIMELVADLDRARLSGTTSGLEREHTILQLTEQINLCRRGCDGGIDVNKALSLMWPELLEPINGAVTSSSVRFRMTLHAGNGECVVSVDDVARMDMKHLHATMFTHLRELHYLIRACAGDPRSPQGQRASLIVAELRNFAFCAYATNWRNYIDVEMTTDGSLMPLPGGTESTRRLVAVCTLLRGSMSEEQRVALVQAHRCARRQLAALHSSRTSCRTVATKLLSDDPSFYGPEAYGEVLTALEQPQEALMQELEIHGHLRYNLCCILSAFQCAMLCAASYPRIVPACHIADLLAVMEGEPSMMP